MPGVIDPILVSDALRSQPFVCVDLLRTIPEDMDVKTWTKCLFAGYEQRQALLELINDSSPDAMLYQCRVFFNVPELQTSIPYYGISLAGRGIALGQVLDQSNLPVTNFQGILSLVITVLFQSYIPQA